MLYKFLIVSILASCGIATASNVYHRGQSLLFFRQIFRTLHDADEEQCASHILYKNQWLQKAYTINKCIDNDWVENVKKEDSVALSMAPICRYSSEMVSCMATALRKHPHRCLSQNTLYAESLLKLIERGLSTVCSTIALDSVEIGSFESCLDKTDEKLYDCASNYADSVFTILDTEDSNRGFTKLDTEEASSGITEFSLNFIACLRRSIEICKIKQLDSILKRIQWDMALEVDLRDFGGKISDQRDSLEYEATKLLSGKPGEVYHNSITYFLTKEFNKIYEKIWRFPLQTKSFTTEKKYIMKRDSANTRRCLKEFFRTSFVAAILHHKAEFVPVVDAVCRNPGKVVMCANTAFTNLISTFEKPLYMYMDYLKQFAEELMYTVCVTNSQQWQAIDVSVLNQCVAEQIVQLMQCASQFANKYLNDNSIFEHPNDQCLHSWELLECIEDILGNCKQSNGSLKIQLQNIKRTLTEKLSCGFPYNPLAPALSIATMFNASYTTLDVESHHHTAASEKLFRNKYYRLLDFQIKMNRKTKLAKEQLSNIRELSIKPVGPLFEFLDADYANFYKAMFEQNHDQEKLLRYSVIESKANSSLECMGDLIRNSTTADGATDESYSLSDIVQWICLPYNSLSRRRLWECLIDQFSDVWHCFTGMAGQYFFNFRKFYNEGLQQFCNSTYVIWEGIGDYPQFTVDTCVSQKSGYLNGCFMVFIEAAFMHDRPYALISCVHIMQFMECLEDGIIDCSNARLVHNFQTFKRNVFQQMNCVANHTQTNPS